MLCLACGIEMRLLQVVEDTTMLVSGYEHQTWQCSGCSGVEQRTTFTGKKSQAHRVLAESDSVQPTQTATDKLTQIEPVEPTPVLPIQVEQTAQAELTQRTTVESRVSSEETNESQPPKTNGPQTSALILPASVLPKTIDERLRYLTKRATALKEAAAQNKRRAQFKRDWDDLRSVRSPLGSSEALGRNDRDEPVRSPPVPAAAQAPKDEPTGPERAHGWNWRRLLSLGRQKSSLG